MRERHLYVNKQILRTSNLSKMCFLEENIISFTVCIIASSSLVECVPLGGVSGGLGIPDPLRLRNDEENVLDFCFGMVFFVVLSSLGVLLS